MSGLGAALAAVAAVCRLVLAWLAERPRIEADRRARRLARQRDEAGRPPVSADGLLERMRDGRL